MPCFHLLRRLCRVTSWMTPWTELEAKVEDTDAEKRASPPPPLCVEDDDVVWKPTSIPGVDRFLVPFSSGAYGKIYHCRVRGVEKKWVAKIVRASDPKSRTLARKELQNIQAFQHPNIVSTVCFEWKRDSLCLFLVYAGQCDLVDWSSTRACRDTAIRAGVFRQLLGAVSHMHGMGYAHGDLKLDNVMIRTSDRHVTIVDMGSCRHVQDGHFPVQRGTFSYMPPESILFPDSPPNFASDMWSIGMMLFAMLTGKFPFQHASMDDSNFVKLLDSRKADLVSVSEIFRIQEIRGCHTSSTEMAVMNGTLRVNPLFRISSEGAVRCFMD